MKAMLPLLSKSKRLQGYLIDRARRDYLEVIQQTASQEHWTPEHLQTRLLACNHLAGVVKEVLPQLNSVTQQRLIENIFYHETFTRTRVAEQYLARHGEEPPQALLISPSMACNLRCVGCWAAEYGKGKKLSEQKLDDILTEAKNEMGIHFVVVTGGEPTIYKPLWNVIRKHTDIAFMLYTNAQAINATMADEIAQRGNVYPCISIDGDREATNSRRGNGVYEKIETAMKELKTRGVFFGISCTHTRENHNSLVREEYFENLIEKGAHIGWLFHYIPLGDDPNPDLSPTPEQRVERYKLVQRIRDDGKPILMYDFWMDGPITNGCVGWGKRYVHVTADGNVEPCAFIHFAHQSVCDKVSNGNGGLRDRTLTECVNQPWLKEARRMQPFDDNLLIPCPYVDNPDILKQLTEKHGIAPSHPGAEQCTSGPVYEAVKKNAEEYREYLDQIGLKVQGSRNPDS